MSRNIMLLCESMSSWKVRTICCIVGFIAAHFSEKRGVCGVVINSKQNENDRLWNVGLHCTFKILKNIWASYKFKRQNPCSIVIIFHALCHNILNARTIEPKLSSCSDVGYFGQCLTKLSKITLRANVLHAGGCSGSQLSKHDDLRNTRLT